jgi:hypothetical protein
VEKKLGKIATPAPANPPEPQPSASSVVTAKSQAGDPVAPATSSEPRPATTPPTPADPQPAKRKTWTPKAAAAKEQQPNPAETKLPDA